MRGRDGEFGLLLLFGLFDLGVFVSWEEGKSGGVQNGEGAETGGEGRKEGRKDTMIIKARVGKGVRWR